MSSITKFAIILAFLILGLSFGSTIGFPIEWKKPERTPILETQIDIQTEGEPLESVVYSNDV